MSEFHSTVSLPPVPDDLTIPQYFLDTSPSLRPARPANCPWFIEDGTGKCFTESEAQARTNALANGLSIKWNLAEDDVVCLFSPNQIDYPLSVWAVLRVGGIVSPANPAYTKEELTYQLQATKAKGIIVYSDYLPTVVSAAQNVGIERIAVIQGSNPVKGFVTIQELVDLGSENPQNFSERRLRPGEAKTKLAFLSFSSGTTGRPKAVAIPHISVIANVLQMATHWRINDPNDPYKRMPPGAVVAGVLPLFHIYGLVVTLHLALFAGMSILVIPKFNFNDFVGSLVRYRVTHLFLVPPQVVLFCKNKRPFDSSHVRVITSGAAPLGGELLVQLTKIFPNASIGQGYGLTETCTTVATQLPHQNIAKVGSSGALLPGITARVIRPDGKLAGDGEQGELVLKGPSNALRYLDNDQATKETFIDGWVRTGDEVIIHDGELYIVDRLKEIIKVRGYQVAPAELEAHLLLLPSVADACVVGVQDDYSGELPFAYVVLAPGISKEDGEMIKKQISKHISDAKVHYKWIETSRISFIDAIPKTPSGKILRRVLRDQTKAVRVAKL